MACETQSLIVERSGEWLLRVLAAGGEANAGVATVDPAVLDKAAVVQVKAATGRTLWTRAVPGGPQDKGVIRLSHDYVNFLKPRYAERVSVSVERDSLPDARRIVLQALFPISTNLSVVEQEIGRISAFSRPILQQGLVYRIDLPDFPRPVPFRVVTVDPSPAELADGTRVLVRPSGLLPGHVGNFVTFDDVGGLTRIVNELREFILLPLRDRRVYDEVGIELPRGVLLWGPPGGGKTYLARAIANEVGAHFLYINGPEVVSGIQGGTEASLRRIFGEAMEHAPAVVLVDELDALVPRRGEVSSQADIRVGSQLLALLDGLIQMDQVVIIGTTNRPQAIDPALRRPGRLDREIYVGPPDEVGRLEILAIHTRRMRLEAEAESFLPELAKKAAGYVGADLVEVARNAGLHALRRLGGPGLRQLPAGASVEVEVKREDLEAALQHTSPSALRDTWLRSPEGRWQDLAGVESVLAKLYEGIIFPWRFPELAAQLRLAPVRGVLIWGPPGTGKTVIADGLARETGANLLRIQGPEVFGQWLGQSEAAVRHIFQLAKNVVPAVVVIDPVDTLAPVTLNDGGVQGRVRDQLLAELDALPLGRLVVVGITSDPGQVSPALLRAGRLGLHVAVPLPNAEARRRILGDHLEPREVAVRGSWTDSIEGIVAESEGWSGAELVDLVQVAKRIALRDAIDQNTVTLEVKHLAEAWQRRDQ